MNEDRLTPWQPGAVLIGRGTSSASRLLTGLAAIKANAALVNMMLDPEGESPFITGARYIGNKPENLDQKKPAGGPDLDALRKFVAGFRQAGFRSGGFTRGPEE